MTQTLPVYSTTFIKKWDKYGRMARIRIDNDAKQKLDEIADELDATKTGLASEAIRKFAEDVREDK